MRIYPHMTTRPRGKPDHRAHQPIASTEHPKASDADRRTNRQSNKPPAGQHSRIGITVANELRDLREPATITPGPDREVRHKTTNGASVTRARRRAEDVRPGRGDKSDEISRAIFHRARDPPSGPDGSSGSGGHTTDATMTRNVEAMPESRVFGGSAVQCADVRSEEVSRRAVRTGPT